MAAAPITETIAPGHGFALDRFMQQHAGKRRDKERLGADQRRGNKGRSKTERGHPAGIMQREQQSCRAGQHDLLFRRVNDGLQFAAFERWNQQQRKAERHAPKGDHHRRRAAGQRPFDHRAGNAHARHGKRHKERFLLIVHRSPFWSLAPTPTENPELRAPCPAQRAFIPFLGFPSLLICFAINENGQRALRSHCRGTSRVRIPCAFFNKGDCPAFRVTASLYLHSALFSRTCETFACLQTAADMPAASDRNYSSVSSG